MGAGELELGPGVVVEACSFPSGHDVAIRTLLGKSGLNVIDRLNGDEILGMTAETIRWGSAELPPGVAGVAVRLRVSAFESEAREPLVVEPSDPPVVQSMALLTVQRKAGCLVIESLRLLVNLQMARAAVRTQAHVTGASSALVTGFALRHRMCAE